MSDGFFCICDEEMCYCITTVPVFDTPCDECRAGKHVMDYPVPLPTSARNCAMCAAGVPGRHPDRGGTHPLVNA